MFGAQAITNFKIALEVMGLGMLGIFAVIIAIMLVVVILSKATAKSIEAPREE